MVHGEPLRDAGSALGDAQLQRRVGPQPLDRHERPSGLVVSRHHATLAVTPLAQIRFRPMTRPSLVSTSLGGSMPKGGALGASGPHLELLAFNPQRSRPQLESQLSMSLMRDSFTTFASGVRVRRFSFQ